MLTHHNLFIMKHLQSNLVLSFFALGLIVFTPSLALAQTTKPSAVPTQKTTPTPKEETESKPIDDTLKIIKEKIEDKVDEINKSSKKVIVGVLNKIEDDTLELTQENGKAFKVNIDTTVTKFFSTTLKATEEIEKTDLDKNDLIIVFGPIIEDQISANKVIKQSHYVTAQGEITSIDSANFTIDIVTSDKEEISLDIEQTTTQQIIDVKTFKLTKAGFSKFKIGDRIHAVYVKPAKESDKASTVRILILPQEFFAAPLEPSVTPKS